MPKLPAKAKNLKFKKKNLLTPQTVHTLKNVDIKKKNKKFSIQINFKNKKKLIHNFKKINQWQAQAIIKIRN